MVSDYHFCVNLFPCEGSMAILIGGFGRVCDYHFCVYLFPCVVRYEVLQHCKKHLDLLRFTYIRTKIHLWQMSSRGIDWHLSHCESSMAIWILMVGRVSDYHFCVDFFLCELHDGHVCGIKALSSCPLYPLFVTLTKKDGTDEAWQRDGLMIHSSIYNWWAGDPIFAHCQRYNGRSHCRRCWDQVELWRR